jgi:hypothetical protein
LSRDDFLEPVKRILANRVNNQCSNPDCRSPTSGPQSDAAKAMNVGVAAHITAAASGGPRYDDKLSPEERASIENAIWLCQICAKRVDSDPPRYPTRVLHAWKVLAEAAADAAIGRPPAAPERLYVVELSLDRWDRNITPKLHEYSLQVAIKNVGSKKINEWHMEVELPTALLYPGRIYMGTLKDRSDHNRTRLRFTNESHGGAIYPGDRKLAAFDYRVDEELYHSRDRFEVFKQIIRLEAFVEGERAGVCEKTVQELQHF